MLEKTEGSGQVTGRQPAWYSPNAGRDLGWGWDEVRTGEVGVEGA